MKLQRVIMLNMSGEDVKFVQTKLKEFGIFSAAIDGFYGQNLLVSVTNFQRRVGIKSDGIIGMQTWSQISNFNPNPIVAEEKAPVVNPVKNDIPFKPSFIGENGFMIYDSILPDDEYIKKETKKDTIWLHHTAGGSRPDWTIGGWDKDYVKDKKGNPVLDKNGNPIPLKVGTQFVIGRKSSSDGNTTWDGKILKAFDDRYWAYHLGINHAKNEELNSSSIAIELCNYGPLTEKNGQFFNYVNRLVMDSEVVELDKEFRGFKYWERYTDAQLESTRNLIKYLQNRWGIEIQKDIYDTKWFEYNSKWFTTGGLRSHTQVRVDKYDIFPQTEMIQMLNSL